uniref:Uncharacterized protein n=1 Tax=Anguilla anguilla TaxID=7936 RepID=A0A0E9U467_ANGAN
MPCDISATFLDKCMNDSRRLLVCPLAYETFCSDLIRLVKPALVRTASQLV